MPRRQQAVWLVDMTQAHQATHSKVSGCRSGVPGPGISPYHSVYHSQSPPRAARDRGKVKAGRAQAVSLPLSSEVRPGVSQRDIDGPKTSKTQEVQEEGRSERRLQEVLIRSWAWWSMLLIPELRGQRSP